MTQKVLCLRRPAPLWPVAATIFALTVALAFSQSTSESAAEAERVRHYRYAELEKVPQKERALPNPLAGDPDALAAGQKLFVQNCAPCHGVYAQGTRRAPSLRAPEVQNATPGTLFWIVTNGVPRRGMPVWSKLPDLERWQIITFVKSVGIAPRP